MPIDAGIFRNYAIAKGRESGRMVKPKTIYDVHQIATFDYSEFERVYNQLKKYGVSLNHNQLRVIIRRAIKPTLIAAQQNVARIDKQSTGDTTGNLFDSLGFITGKSKDFPNIQIGPRVKRGWKGFHGVFVEFGTHIRSTRSGFNRGAARPTPYMQPAFDKTVTTVTINFRKEVADYVEEVAQKLF